MKLKRCLKNMVCICETNVLSPSTLYIGLCTSLSLEDGLIHYLEKNNTLHAWHEEFFSFSYIGKITQN